MTAAEQSAKEEKPILKGLVEAIAPDDKTKIFIRPPRGPGPWYRINHKEFGHRLIKAADEKEAVQKYFEEFSPATAKDEKWTKESMRLNGGRIAKAYD